MPMMLEGIVLNGFTEPINDLRADLTNRGEILIRAAEVVARRLFRVAREIREDRTDVHHVRTGPVRILQTRREQIQRSLCRGEVDHTSTHKRPGD